MRVYFGIGSNKDNRSQNIERVLSEFGKHQINPKRCSSFYESESMVPLDSPPSWHKPYLNAIVETETNLSTLDLLIACKEIEKDMGRVTEERHAPRIIDLDILLCDERVIDEDGLKVPHPEILRRPFVLDPLAQMIPSLIVPGTDKTVLEHSRMSKQHLPAVMGIMNLTPDSFSSGGSFKTLQDFETEIDGWISENIEIIDLGAESTRPGAKTLTDLEEWTRLSPALEIVRSKLTGPFCPRMSVDTYHPSTARKAIDLGASIINDVSGLKNPEMVGLIKESQVDVVAVHNLGIPADKSVTIPLEDDPVKYINDWISTQMRNWEKDGLDFDRIILDPGIGFGKTVSQSLALMKSIEVFQSHGLRILVGHSRKSFMNLFAKKNFRGRDYETLGASMKLAQHGVDIVRVHNPLSHRRAFRAWTALQGRDGSI